MNDNVTARFWADVRVRSVDRLYEEAYVYALDRGCTSFEALDWLGTASKPNIDACLVCLLDDFAGYDFMDIDDSGADVD